MKPEDYRADSKRPFNSQEYLNSLKDGREIYIYGERVQDVTTHPAFRNSAASIGTLYDALHDPVSHDQLCWQTDTGNGGYTHKFFRFARSPDEMRQQRDAIADWSRLSYGWMGRTPDYKAAFGCALGAFPEYYGQFEANARRWYQRIQESCLYFNHAIVNPPIDRHKPADQVRDVYIQLEKETDAGIIVSGAKVVATNSALTHYNCIGFGSAQVMGQDPNFALMFVAPMDAPGVKLISRASYELVAGATGSPFDYPLSSRFDENDAILVLDKVLIPWENVLIYQDFDRCRNWTVQGGFARLFPMQACIRLAVKLDFITALLKRSLECTGVLEFRGVQADLGEVVAWRNLFWSLSDAMWAEAKAWKNGAFLPDLSALQTYRVMAPMAYNKIKLIVEKNVTSGLIYLPSSVRDLQHPELEGYLAKYVRGSNGIDHIERIKILKLMWDAMGSEFGGRHELYEINYAGSQDEIRLQCLRAAEGNGSMKQMTDMVERCLSDYDINGWKVPHLTNPDDINQLDKLSKS
ncbi:MAG: 4-hydroxyphenylacetate 3-monooxygenase, oxygenase component [Enterobacteriaceae bacterium]